MWKIVQVISVKKSLFFRSNNCIFQCFELFSSLYQTYIFKRFYRNKNSNFFASEKGQNYQKYFFQKNQFFTPPVLPRVLSAFQLLFSRFEVGICTYFICYFLIYIFLSLSQFTLLQRSCKNRMSLIPDLFSNRQDQYGPKNPAATIANAWPEM